jgi:hypothetical protein
MMMTFITDKRGQESPFELAKKTVFFMVAGIVIIALFFLFGYYVTSYEWVVKSVPTRSQAESIAMRFVSSPACFAYRDAQGNVHPRVIAITRFTENILRECYSSADRKDFQFQLILDNRTIETERWLGVKSFTLIQPVLVKEEERLTPRRLIIHVQESV